MTIVGNEYMPYLIRIAVLFIIAVSVYDFIRRRSALKITSLLKEQEATSPDRALHINAIKDKLPHAEILFRFFLREGSMLRRIVVCKKTSAPVTEKKKKRTLKKPDTENSSWYLIGETYSDSSSSIEGTEKPRKKYRSAGVLGREGADTSIRSLIIGILLTVAGGELLVRFLPNIAALLAKSGYLF